MVAGQVSDLEAEGEPVTVEMLDYININKTGAMIKAAVKAGADLGGGDYDTMNKLNEYAENLGLAFQVRDDILDIVGNVEELGKNTGADEAKDKSNYPAIFGLDKSYEKMERHLDLAYSAIAPFYDNAEFFYHILDMRSKDRLYLHKECRTYVRSNEVCSGKTLLPDYRPGRFDSSVQSRSFILRTYQG